MNISFNLELSSGNPSTQMKSVLIRCTLNRKHLRIATGVTLLDKQWDKKNQKINRSHSMCVELNQLIIEKLKKVTSVYSTLLSKSDDVSLRDIKEELAGNTNESFYDFAKNVKLAEIGATNKLGTYRRYETAINKFVCFIGKNQSINKVNYTLIRQYELYLLNELKNSRDTVSSNLSVIRSIINEAIKHDVYKHRNPFQQIRLTYTDNTKEKLTAAELYKIINNPLPTNNSLHLAKDFFLACFFAEGTRGGDMVLMQKENIVNQHLVFKQQKTGMKMIIPITDSLDNIFKKYDSQPYLFPLLSKEKVVNEFTINSKLTYINKYLKEVAKYCGIFKNLSTHVARHTFTDLALEVSNGNIYQVQQSLGHTSVKTTEIYSRNRVNYDKQSLLPNIITLINSTDKTE